MSYPKWRHHPTKESLIVTNADFEASQAPDSDGWRDDRNFSEEAPKNKGGRPRKVQE